MLRLILLSLFAATIADDSETCTKEEQGDDTRAWINWVGRLMVHRYGVMKYRQFDHVKELHANFTKAFTEAGCPELWTGNYTQDDHTTPGWHYIKNFVSIAGGKSVPEVIVFAKELEDFVFTVGRDHVFSECFITEMRNLIFKWLNEKCAKDHFYIKLDGVMNFPVPNYSEDEELEQTVRAYVAQFLRAQLTATKCGGVENYPKTVSLIAKWDNIEYCYAAVDSFESDACFALYERSCPVVFSCLNEFFQHFGKYALEMFSGSEVSNVRKCLQRSSKYWKGKDKSSKIPSHGNILARAIRLYRTVLDLPKSYTKGYEEKVMPYVQALITANFKSDMCYCDIYRDSAEQFE